MGKRALRTRWTGVAAQSETLSVDEKSAGACGTHRIRAAGKGFLRTTLLFAEKPHERTEEMNWKFWEKSEGGAAKLQGPKDLPPQIGFQLVTVLKKDPDWVWKLKVCYRPAAGGDGMQDVRVFDPRQAMMAKVAVKDFSSLDDRRELILYEGTFNRKTKEVQIREMVRG